MCTRARRKHVIFEQPKSPYLPLLCSCGLVGAYSKSDKPGVTCEPWSDVYTTRVPGIVVDDSLLRQAVEFNAHPFASLLQELRITSVVSTVQLARLDCQNIDSHSDEGEKSCNDL